MLSQEGLDFKTAHTTKTVPNSFVDPDSIIICTISGTNGIPRTITSCVAGVRTVYSYHQWRSRHRPI